MTEKDDLGDTATLIYSYIRMSEWVHVVNIMTAPRMAECSPTYV